MGMMRFQFAMRISPCAAYTNCNRVHKRCDGNMTNGLRSGKLAESHAFVFHTCFDGEQKSMNNDNNDDDKIKHKKI